MQCYISDAGIILVAKWATSLWSLPIIPCINLLLSASCVLFTVDTCQPNPCLNSGACMANGNSFQCQCPDGYSGEICDSEYTLQVSGI